MKSKKVSIKRRLIFALCAVLSVALIITYLISFFNVKKETQEVFDAHLVRSAKLVFGLIHHEVGKNKNHNFFVDFNLKAQQKTFERYENKTHFQAWKNDEMIYSSDEKISLEPDYEGFRDVLVDDTKWRSFSFYDAESQIRVLVSERNSMRRELVSGILLSLFVPLLLSFLPLFFIISATVNRRLNPLHRLAFKMKKMSTTTLQPFKGKEIPLELKPFIDSFNSLISRLHNALESERRFTDYAAHELKTPLAAIKIQAQLLQKNQDRQREKEYLEDLLAGVDRATHLVNQLLTLARIEPDFNAKFITKEAINLRQIIGIVVQNFSLKAEAKNLEIVTSYDGLEDAQMLIAGHETYIEVMLNNLLDNAIKYSHENGKIKVVTTRKNDLLQLQISNHGDTISPAAIAKIFDNFYRVDKAERTRQVAGSGLGLAIVKKIVQLHGGTIAFHSDEKGENTVDVALPAVHS
jgi:two-component system sensor histidine kinase QseC